MKLCILFKWHWMMRFVLMVAIMPKELNGCPHFGRSKQGNLTWQTLTIGALPTCSPTNLFFQASMLTQSLIFPSINTGFSPRPFLKKLRMIEQRKKQRKGSCNFYYQFSHKLSVLPWANNFTAMSFIFFHPQNKETEINVPALICYEYFSQVYLILNYRIDIALMYEHHLIVLLFD